MAANNRGNMRPINRSPPFLAIGLFVALVILGFNYWNLSVKNGEQFNEISVMERELKLVSAKRTAIEKRAEAIQDKVKYLEDELNKQKGVAGEKSSALATAQNERDTIAQAKDELQTEYNLLKEKLPLCEKEVAELKEAVKIAKDELEQKKNEQPHAQTCEESECANYIASARDKTLEDIVKVAGSAPLINLYKDGGNVGKFAETVRSFLANQVPAQQPAQQATQQPVQQPEQPAQQPFQPNQPIVGQPQQGQVEIVGNQQQPPAEEVKQDTPKAPESYKPGNTLVSMSQQQQPAVNDQQPQVPQPQVAAPVLGDDKHLETGDPFKQNPAIKTTFNTTYGLTKSTPKGTVKPLTSSNRTTLSPVQLKTLTAISKEPQKKDENEIPKTQVEANKNQTAKVDDKLDADKKVEADKAEDYDEDDEDLDKKEDGAVPLPDKTAPKVAVGDVDKVGDADDADYDDDADVADDRLKIDEKDQDADEYEYEDDPKDPKVDNDNQNDYDDGDDDNYDDGKADDGDNDKHDGVEEMKIQLDKDKTI